MAMSKDTEIIPRTKPSYEGSPEEQASTDGKQREPRTVKINIDPERKTALNENKFLDSQYTIMERIGDGGMGIVYLAQDHKLGRHVAIKRLTSKALQSSVMKQRFFQEAKSVAALTHTNIVHIYALNEDHEGPFIVMEYVSGPADRSPDKTPPAPFGLADKIHRDGPMPLAEALEMILKLCRAMEYAHGKGVIHRDLKPSNILLDAHNEPKIVDFGLARQVDHEDNKLTVPGERMLSVGYGAPEQEQDATLTDQRADVYGLGALLYFCLTGQNPRYFRQNDVPHEVQLPIVKALETNKEERWPSVQEFATALISVKDLSTVEVPNIKTTWRCKWCDTLNPVTVQFCGECGWDGGTTCMECGIDTRVGIQFCGNCGADAREYEQANNLLKRLQKHLKDKDFSYVSRHAERSSRFRPVGPNGRKIITDILDARKKATKAEERIKTLKEIIPQEISSQNYERAMNYIKEYDTLTSDHQFEHTSSNISILQIERDTRRARKAIARGDWDYAIRMCKDVLQQNPDDRHEIHKIFRSIHLHKTGATIRNIVLSVLIVITIYLLSAAPVFKMLGNKRNPVFNSMYMVHDLIHKATLLNIPLEKYAQTWNCVDIFKPYRRTDRVITDNNTTAMPVDLSIVEKLSELKTPYERDILRMEVNYTQNVTKWPDEYIDSLSKLQDKMQQNGDFEGWESVNSEIQWFKEDKVITKDTIVYQPQELRTLQIKYKDLLDQYEIDKSKNLIQRTDKYIQHLSDMMKDFTRNGEMNAAAIANAEIKRVKANPALAQAKAVLVKHNINTESAF